MNDPLLSLLGMCRRAGRMTVGFQKSADAIKGGRATLVLVAADTAPRTEKEARFLAKEAIPVIRLTHSAHSLSHAIGLSAGLVALTDEGFARQALRLIQNGGM